MKEPPYTKREQDLYRLEVIATLNRIEAQTTKTNGRVSKLEEDQDAIEQWQAYLKGGMAVLSLMVVPVLIYLIINWPK